MKIGLNVLKFAISILMTLCEDTNLQVLLSEDDLQIQEKFAKTLTIYFQTLTRHRKHLKGGKMKTS